MALGVLGLTGVSRGLSWEFKMGIVIVGLLIVAPALYFGWRRDE